MHRQNSRTSPHPRSVRLRLEQLENRLAPATLVSPTTVTYQDGDGDGVAVTASQAIFDAATVNQVLQFDTGSVNGDNSTPQKLQKIDLSAVPSAAAGTSLQVQVTSVASGSKGLVNVGAIDAHGIDLGDVTVQGDLARILAGDSVTSTAGLHSLTVDSMGQFGNGTQGAGASLSSAIKGSLGNLTVHGNLTKAVLSVTSSADGKIGSIQIDGSLQGGPVDGSGRIVTTGDIGQVTIHGGIVGGGGANSGVLSSGGQIAGVTLGGDLAGGAGAGSGQITAAGQITTVQITGSVKGFAGLGSGSISSAAGLGSVSVGGNVQGGVGQDSGSITITGTLNSLSITGSLLGDAGPGSATVSAGSVGQVTVGQDVRGGFGQGSARFLSQGDLNSISIGGSLVGGASGSGLIESTGILGTVSIQGDICGGSNAGSDAVDRTGYIQGGRITSVTVGGNIFAGSNTGSSTLSHTGSIRSVNDIGTILVKGCLVGSGSNPVIISARGQPVQGLRQDLAIDKLKVLLQVIDSEILAGYDVDGNPVNGDAQIGTVYCGQDWTASTVAAGIAAGADGLFGTADDTRIPGTSKQIRSRINLITIQGTIHGTPDSQDPNDHYGFVAELIHGMKVGGTDLALNPGPHNDTIELGTTGDVTLREV